MDRYEFLLSVTEQIRTKRACPMIVKEIEDHIEDQKAAYMAEGMTASEAEEAAVKEMGDPVETGVQLDRIHRPKMEWKVLAGALLMGIMGVVLQGIVAASQYSRQMPDWQTAVFGNVEKQALGLIFGIVVMMIVCYLDYSLLEKCAFPVWIALHVFMILCVMFGSTVNGRSVRAAEISYFLIPFYAGTVYHFRGKGGRGLLKSIVCLLISLLVIRAVPSLAGVCIVGAVGIIILSLAIHRKWFGDCRKKRYAELYGSLAAAAAGGIALSVISYGYVLSGYQMERLHAWSSRELWDYPMIMVSRAASSAREGGVLDPEGAMELVAYVKNDYLWRYLFEYLGSAKGILLILIFATFMAMLFRMAFRQKNRLGYIVGAGCTMYLGFHALLYVGMNFGAVPIGGTYMPFLSNGNSALLSTYFYMGILLSIYRNSNVVRN